MATAAPRTRYGLRVEAPAQREHAPRRRGAPLAPRNVVVLAALSLVLVSALPGCGSDDDDLATDAFTNRGAQLEGFSKEGLERVHDTMAGYVERGALPGMVTLLSRRGAVQVDAIGLSSLDGSPMQRDTIFRIASMTKPLTAAATMILVEEGALSLEEPVDRLLPELANRRVLARLDGPLEDTTSAARPITVRDLLTFTLGFGITFPFDAYPVQQAATDLQIGYGPPDPRSTPEPDEWLRRLGTLPLMYQPGERWVYNTGSDVLGVLISRAAGQPFDVFLRERIFGPLGMDDTGFSVPASKLNRFTASYFANPATGGLDLFDGIEDSAWGEPPAFPSGAGGLVSTVDDFLVFAQLLLDEGRHEGRQILSVESVQSMTTDQLTPAQKVDDSLFPGFWQTHGWGFGVSMVTAPDDVSPVPGRYGWDGGLGTYWFSDPTKDFCGILLTQRAIDEASPANDFWTAVYQAMTE